MIEIEKLSGRISGYMVKKIAATICNDGESLHCLFDIMRQADDAVVARNAAWIMTHIPNESLNHHLGNRRDELIDIAIGELKFRRGLILTLLLGFDLTNNIRIDLLDFCMANIGNESENSSCRAIMMKIAAKMCDGYPELKEELRMVIEMLPQGLPPCMLSVKKRILRGYK